MARARNLKPGLFKNELLGVADPLLTILFQSLWCLADREGRLEDRPLRIKAETFPYRDNIDINVYLTELERMGFIHRYVVAGVALIQVVNFLKHQNPHKTEKASDLPEMSMNSDGCALTVKAPLNNGSRPADSLLLIPDSLNLIPDTKPIQKQKPAPDGAEDIFLGIDNQIVIDYKKLRKAKNLPATKTAMEGVKREADKAGLSFADAIRLCCERGWAGFKAEWILQPNRAAPAMGIIGQATKLTGVQHGNFGAQDYRAGIAEDGSF